MEQNDILDALSEYKNQFAEKYGILAIGIFGSTARNEDQKDSDADVIIRLAKPELFTLVGIKQDLEAKFDKPVDINDPGIEWINFLTVHTANFA